MSAQRAFEGIPVQYRHLADVGNFYAEMRGAIRESMNQDAYLAIIAPDNIYSKGSLFNAYKLVRYKNMCVAAAHPRVKAQDFMAKYPANKTYEKRELVAIAMQDDMMHNCLRHAFDDVDVNYTFQGLSIRRMGDKAYAVVATLSTPVIFKLSREDMDFMDRTLYGDIDRSINKRLFDEQRIKLIGSSDICFFVELTRPECNFGACRSGLLNNDRHETQGQNIWNNTLAIWQVD